MLPDGSKQKFAPYLASAAILVAVAGIGFWAKGAPAEVPLRIEPLSRGVENASTGRGGRTTAPPPRLVVHMAGEVNRPGVYELGPNARLVEALRLAGGTRPAAATDRLNLAAPLRDGQKIVVPRKELPARLKGTLAKAAPAPAPLRSVEFSDGQESEETIPPVIPSATSAEPVAGETGEISPVEPAPEEIDPRAHVESAPSRATVKRPEKSSEKPALLPSSIPLNSATRDELARLPGIGPSLAFRILLERQRRGGFRSVLELLEVKGIGPVKLGKMRPYLRL